MSRRPYASVEEVQRLLDVVSNLLARIVELENRTIDGRAIAVALDKYQRETGFRS